MRNLKLQLKTNNLDFLFLEESCDVCDTAGCPKTANSIRARVLNHSLLQFVIEHFKSVSVLDFHSSLKEENVPYIKRDAQKMASFIC